VLHRSKVSRPGLLAAIGKLKPRLVVMEACSSAHHWARCLQAMGIEAKLISPQYVAPFVKTNKNDRNDAEAIVEAASRPTMRFVAVKTVEQQDMQSLHQLRQLLVHQSTSIINQMRGVLAERGIVIAQSPSRPRPSTMRCRMCCPATTLSSRSSAAVC
jgi:transposase